jgi:leucyl aminopeptidase
MLPCFTATPTAALPLWALPAGSYQAWLAGQSEAIKAWLDGSGFEVKPGATALLPGADGAPCGALVVLSEPAQPWDMAAGYARLPAGDWQLQPEADPGPLALGWALASYRFDRYRKRDDKPRRLGLTGVAAERAAILAEAIYLARDLINTPAADLGPAELADAVQAVAARHGAS